MSNKPQLRGASHLTPIPPTGEPPKLPGQDVSRWLLTVLAGAGVAIVLMIASHYFGFSLKLDLHISN